MAYFISASGIPKSLSSISNKVRLSFSAFLSTFLIPANKSFSNNVLSLNSAKTSSKSKFFDLRNFSITSLVPPAAIISANPIKYSSWTSFNSRLCSIKEEFPEIVSTPPFDKKTTPASTIRSFCSSDSEENIFSCASSSNERK